MTDNLLQKVIETTTIGGDNTPGRGGLTYEQADRFIDYMWDATVLGSLVRTRRMTAVTEEIDTIAVGRRLMRGAREAVDTGENAGVTFGKLSITAKKLRLDWELSSESLEDNIEGEELEDHIARLMATQAGNDLEDLAINGDMSSSDPLLKVDRGFRDLLINGDESDYSASPDGTNGRHAHIVDAAGAGLDRGILNRALRAMPRKYMKRRQGLKFLTGSNAIQDYLFSLQQTANGYVTPEVAAESHINQAVRTEGPAGYITDRAFGLQIQEVPLFSEIRGADGAEDEENGDNGEMWLVDPSNLVWGIKRDITVHREFKPKKDSIEYTVYVRQGVQIENLDACVVVTNLGTAL